MGIRHIKPSKRKRVLMKYGGRCAYSGTLLGDDWEVDHLIPYSEITTVENYPIKADNIINLMPCQRVINEHKSHMSLEEFRDKILKNLHRKLAEIKYANLHHYSRKDKSTIELASYFGITEEMPFTGKFYFETLRK